MRFWMLLAACVAIGLVIVLILRRRSTPEAEAIRPYSEIRRDVIGKLGSAGPPANAMPTRPPGLDTRLGAAAQRELAAHWPPTRENWNSYERAWRAVIDSIDVELRAIDPELEWYELLSQARGAVIVVDRFEAEINNGGFDQYFLNSAGDGARMLPEALRLIGSPEAAALADEANAQFPGGPARQREARLAQMDALPESAAAAWDGLGSRFHGLKVPFGGIASHSGGRFVLDHADEFFKPD